MKHQLYNRLGQPVGTFDDVTKVYDSVRSKSKGEIFFKKNWFEGRFIKTPVAIDVAILDKLLKNGCRTIRLLVMGVKTRSYAVSFDINHIVEKGIKINYDRYNKQGKNITHFSNQVVFGLEDGSESEQKRLKLDG